MQSRWSRRAFLGAAGAAALTLAACSRSGDDADGKAVTVAHVFGETTIEAPPTKVVSAGFTEQDSLLALGVIPIATTEWWGAEPFAVWPWARAALGSAQPAVLNLADGIQVDQIEALEPDLILALNAGCDAESYQQLSAIAPTVAQPGYAPFFGPWRDQAASIGAACFASAAMTDLVTAVDDSLDAVAAEHPEFTDKSAVLLQGNVFDNTVIATAAGHGTEFLTRMGFTIPDGLGEFGDERGGQLHLPLDQIGAALRDVDVLIWTTDTDDAAARLLAEPQIAALPASAAQRNVFTGKELAGAIGFSSVLSYPVVADQLPPLLTGALGA